MNKIKNLILFVFLITGVVESYAQKEANIWYFGRNAGLDFNSGSPISISGSQMNTYEGCATISDVDGNLLFYSDGSIIWNKNHEIMLNGTGLKGHWSSTNSAIIIPKPNTTTIYYVFTVDGVDFGGQEDGIHYSEIDMSLDGGLGGVTSNKNIFLLKPSTEQLTAVKHAIKNEYWVVSHKWNSDEFVVYNISENGVNNIPVISPAGVFLSGNLSKAVGAIKISPNGKKIAAVIGEDTNAIQVFEFNAANGTVGSEIVTIDYDMTTHPYGVEFSPDSKLLYVSNAFKGVYQYNIGLSFFQDIIDSEVALSNVNNKYGALQLAVDGKIYIARVDKRVLDVINTPNNLGANCDYENETISLGNNSSRFGLPPFIQSFFHIDKIAFDKVCFGDETEFALDNNVDSVVWDFGDPMSGINNTSNEFNPIHVFTSPGIYEVSVTAILGTQSSVETIAVTIYGQPSVNSIVELKQCDDDLDGFSSFNLNEAINKITANAVNETITFHEFQTEAASRINPIINTTAYTNQNASLDVIWARVENVNNCFSVSQIDLVVSTTQIPNTFIRDFYKCDDINDGDSTNGISIFDFSSVNTEIEAMFPSGQQPIIAYYRNQVDALAEENPILDISNYRNVGYPITQDIYIRVDSGINNDCLGLGHHIALHVEQQPIAYPVIIPEQCDADGDGMFGFDTSNVEAEILSGQGGMQVVYIDEQGNVLPSPLPSPFLTRTQDIKAIVTNSTSQDPNGNCTDETILNFVVDAAVVAHPVNDLINCDVDNDGMFEFDTSNIESQVLNGQTGMLLFYTDANGNQLQSPLPNPFLSSSQEITIRIENPLNNVCYDKTTFQLVTIEQPTLNMDETWLICEGDSVDIVADVGYDEYLWSTGETTSTIKVFNAGVFEVTTTNVFNGVRCEASKVLTVIESNVAVITDIITEDWTADDNVITVFVEGSGDYEYSLDGITYQDENQFTNLNINNYIVYVRDKKGCGIVTKEVFLMYYPKYFTPNEDGYHDTWNIHNSSLEPNNRIYIYDRYGKLLKQLSPAGNGWDGTYNGEQMPSNDYWFVVERQNGKRYTGHFTLKR